MTPSTPAATFFFKEWNDSHSASTDIWCSSAVSLSFGFLFTVCRIRATACDTLSRPCVRHVLWCCRFPLVAALPSFDSAETCASLFAAVNGTMPASDWLIPFIFRFRMPPFFQRPWHDRQGRINLSQVPTKGVRTSIDSLDNAETNCTSPFRDSSCCLRLLRQSRLSE